MKLEEGTWVTVEEVMKDKKLNRLEALKAITAMQAKGILGRFVEGKGYPIKYGKSS